MYKIINEETPTYLIDLLPNTAEDRSGYTLRNSNIYTIPFARLSSFQSSFFPSTLRLWTKFDLVKLYRSSKEKLEDTKFKLRIIFSLGT